MPRNLMGGTSLSSVKVCPDCAWGCPRIQLSRPCLSPSPGWSESRPCRLGDVRPLECDGTFWVQCRLLLCSWIRLDRLLGWLGWACLVVKGQGMLGRDCGANLLLANEFLAGRTPGCGAQLEIKASMWQAVPTTGGSLEAPLYCMASALKDPVRAWTLGWLPVMIWPVPK